jgi:hypothetical protein
MLHRLATVASLAAVVLCTTLSRDAAAGPFEVGDFVSYAQDDWESSQTTAGALLLDHWDALYPNGVEIGVPGAGGNSAKLTSPDAVGAYLVAGDTAGPLDNDYLDPESTPAGRFGGVVLALQFNVDLGDAGALMGSAGVPLGDLVLVDLGLGDYNGLTVREYLQEVNRLLGGVPLLPGPDPYSPIADLTDDITRAFAAGTTSAFAQDHLRMAAQSVPEPATLSLLGVAAAALAARRGRTRQSPKPTPRARAVISRS